MFALWQKIGNFEHKSTLPGLETTEPDEIGEFDKTDGLDKLDELEVGKIKRDERAVKANWNQHQNT